MERLIEIESIRKERRNTYGIKDVKREQLKKIYDYLEQDIEGAIQNHHKTTDRYPVLHGKGKEAGNHERNVSRKQRFPKEWKKSRVVLLA